ncbi:MAG: SIS domain-containing protein [Saprospiraceae bacterium]|jgi:D-sedoheptulose 7-phosphate isomerase|nr:SIS domain-containing protein [Saprospiraceae bacterium]MBK7795813.1 SIS domain-containing protein [Saprospiraceae bacterium]MBK8154367.1 SIS domain-containing protein [Saprospiraceae bacterium]MBK9379387.1 SIS domain-containing protein [Saprospiraceae bacterium]MBL0260926.1 SIS domain-containing protein [Saprospiraceae bacterium]
MKSKIENIIRESIAVKTALVSDSEMIRNMENASNWITEAISRGGRIYFCGNGGSAADAQHLAAELSGRFYKDRPALAAEALHCNSSYLTAVANDYSYEVIFQRMIAGFGKKEDILVGLSTSGNSRNIVLAFEAARNQKMKTIGLTGIGGGKMKELSDILICVPSGDTPRIQESHILIGHIICQLVEEKLFLS